jgi:competence protein ComFC
VKEPITSWLEGVDTLLYPRLCHACQMPLSVAVSAPVPSSGGSEVGLCGRCFGEMRRLETPYCLKCGDAFDSEDEAFVCSNCGGRKFHFSFAFSAYRAEGPLLYLIHQFKYSHQLHLAVPLAQLLAQAFDEPRLRSLLEERPWIVPVPLHPRRQREREYNQAAELARLLAQKLGLTFCPCLRRSRYTVTQTRLDRKDRLQNIRQAFTMKLPRSLRKEWPGDQPVLLIDDVLTTGATASACAKILRLGGASDVVVLTLARG